MAFGGVLAALWAVHNYRMRQKIDAARMMKDLHTEFYTDPDLVRGAELFDYDYDRLLKGIFGLRVASRHVELSADQRELLRVVDRVLNFFEQILYLESGGHFSKADRMVFFDYWFESFVDAGKPALHRYLARNGYEHLAKALKLHADDYVVFYGTLMSSDNQVSQLGLEDKLELVGKCTAPGALVDLGEWPGALDGAGEIKGELWRVRNFDVFRQLDPFERYDPANEEASYYVRTIVRLIEPAGTDAWMYRLKQAEIPLHSFGVIEGGDWNAHVTQRRFKEPDIRSATGDDEALINNLLLALNAPLDVRMSSSCGQSSSPIMFVAEFHGALVGVVIAHQEPVPEAPIRVTYAATNVERDLADRLLDRMFDRLAELARSRGAGRLDFLVCPPNSHSAAISAAMRRLAGRLGNDVVERKSDWADGVDAGTECTLLGVPSGRPRN